MKIYLSRDAGPGIYTVRKEGSNTAIGRVYRVVGGYRAVYFTNPRRFLGPNLGIRLRRRDAIAALVVYKAVNDSHDEGYLTLAEDGLITRTAGVTLVPFSPTIAATDLVSGGYLIKVDTPWRGMSAYAVPDRFDRERHDALVRAIDAGVGQ